MDGAQEGKRPSGAEKPSLKLKGNAKDALWVAGGNYFALLAGLPLAFITPAFLDPTLYGIVAVIDIITEFLKHYHLGTLNALGREIPMMRTRGETERALDVRDGVWTFVFWLGLPVTVIPAALARWVFPQTEQFQLCLLLACITLVILRYAEFHLVMLKAEKRFRDDSRIGIAATLVPLVTLFPLLWFLRLPGYYLSGLLAACVLWILAFRASGERPRLRLASGIPFLILSFGLPVILMDLVGSAVTNVDRMMLQRVWPEATLGLFFFAFKINRYVMGVPWAIGQVIQRNLLGKLAKAKDERDIAPTILVPAKFLSYTMAFFIGGVALAGPEAIEKLYPKYAGVAAPMRIFLIGAFWPSVAQIAAKHLQGLKRFWGLMFAFLPAIAIVVAGLLFLGDRVTLVTAAIVSSAGLATKAFITLFLSLKALSRKPTDIVTRFAVFLPPFVLLLGLVFGIRHGWTLWIAPHWHAQPLVAGIIQAAVFCLLFSPLLYLVQKQHSIFEKSQPKPVDPAPPVELDPE